MTIIDVLFSLLCLLGLIYLVLFRFKQYRMDRFRQNIFALRDDLFDYAARGNIDFNHPAYTTLRSLMNGYIRFSHRISLLQVIILNFADNFLDRKFHPHTFEEVWNEATVDLDEDVKVELERYRLNASAYLFYYVFLSSFVKKIVVIPCIFILFLKENLSNSSKNDVLIINSKDKGVEVITYKYSKKQVDEQVEHLNTDALAFGKAKASATA